MTKICIKCGEEKNICYFYENGRYSDGSIKYYSTCKVCKKKMSKKYYRDKKLGLDIDRKNKELENFLLKKKKLEKIINKKKESLEKYIIKLNILEKKIESKKEKKIESKKEKLEIENMIVMNLEEYLTEIGLLNNKRE